MEPEAYALGMWRVKPGQEEAFQRLWQELLHAYFLTFPGVMMGTLLRSIDDPTLFYSFAPWRSLADLQAMIADPRTPEMISKLRALCVEASPGLYRRVLTLSSAHEGA